VAPARSLDGSEVGAAAQDGPNSALGARFRCRDTVRGVFWTRGSILAGVGGCQKESCTLSGGGGRMAIM